MARMTFSMLATFSLVLSPCLILRISAMPPVPPVPEVQKEEHKRANATEEPGIEMTIDQTIIDAYGGLEEEKKAEESRKKDDGVETEGMDTLLTPEQAGLLHIKQEDGVSKRRLATIVKVWTNGEVPYDLSGLYSQHHGMMRQAFQEWEQSTCVRFVPAQSHHRHKIVFSMGGGCSSYLGMTQYSQQTVTLGNGCHHKSIYLHELGHALGLVHEHQLPQRDSYIYIETGNVQNGRLDQFTKYTASQIPNAERVTYSLRSIMHYGKYAFSRSSGLQTIHARDKGQEHLMGTSQQLASSDIKVVNLLYNCNGGTSGCTKPPCQSPCYVDNNCRCVCQDTTCVDSNQHCSTWAGYGYCQHTYVEYMATTCRKACRLC